MLEREAYIWLNHFKTMRSKDVEKLSALFGNALDIYNNINKDEAVLSKLQENGILKDTTVKEILECDEAVLGKTLEQKMKKAGISVVTPADKDYPRRLLDIPGKPLALYYRGSIGFASAEHTLAVIGSRRVSNYGSIVADEFTAELSRKKVVIVSGMAYGVDGKAHRGTIGNGGRTIAVLGGGVDICYPATNYDLYMEMCENHLVLSEYEPGTEHLPLHFPARNRIISGLSDGLLVVEAAMRSGTLITADFALEQGRTVYAVPGRVTDLSSRGTNGLIKQGAVLVDSPTDIITDMLGVEIKSKKKSASGPGKNSKASDPGREEFVSQGTMNKRRDGINRSGSRVPVSEKEKEVLGKLGFEPIYIDDIIRVNNMDISGTLQILRDLEEKELIESVEKSYFMLKR